MKAREVDSCADLLVKKIKRHIDLATEKKYIKCKQRTLKPWITQGLVKSIRQRDKLKKISTIQKTEIALKTLENIEID